MAIPQGTHLLRRGMLTAPEAFLECWVCLGNISATGSTLKRPCATLARLVGRVTKATLVTMYYLFYYNLFIDQVGRVFANSPGDLGSISSRVIPKTFKMVLCTSLYNAQYCKVRIKGKVEQFRERVVPFPTPGCSSYWKGRLLVALDYGR